MSEQLPKAEAQAQALETQAPETAAAPVVTSAQPGALLRQARESQGIALETLAGALKVPVDKLRALEDQDWQRLPDVVFLRALAQSVCRTLQIDAQPILADLPQHKVAALAPQLGLNQPVRDRAVPPIFGQPSAAAGSSRWLLALVLLLIVGGVVYMGLQWQSSRQAEPMASGAESADAAQALPVFAPGSVPAQPPLDEAEEAEGAERAEGAATTVSTPPQAVEPPAAAPGAPGQAAPAAAPVANTAATAPTPAGGATPTLRLVAQGGSTWVQVRDAQQRLVVERVLQSGETFSTSQPKPLFVVVGKADVTQVEIDGAAFDVQAKARENVARFEVK